MQRHKGCYVLEGGDYVISARSDSHNVLDEKTVTVADTFWYDALMKTISVRATRAHSLPATTTARLLVSRRTPSLVTLQLPTKFENANTYMTDPSVGNDVTILTRNDWANTQPSAPTDKTRTASDTVIGWLDYNFTTTDWATGKHGIL